MKSDRINSKSELRRSALEAIKAVRCLVELKKHDLLGVGTYKVVHQRLNQLERRLYKLKRKALPVTVIDKVAREVAELLGEFIKSLVRYLLSPRSDGTSSHSGMGVNILEGLTWRTTTLDQL